MLASEPHMMIRHPELRADRRMEFTLPFCLPSLNVQLRRHWAARTRARNALLLEVMAAIGGPAHFPRRPYERAQVKICRYSPKLLDPDNLVASTKQLLDVLCAPSPKHPGSLGIIADDDPERCRLVTKQGRYPTAHTFVQITDLGRPE